MPFLKKDTLKHANEEDKWNNWNWIDRILKPFVCSMNVFSMLVIRMRFSAMHTQAVVAENEFHGS